mmetsp:Transcript_30154/g.69132  ORF Transcript_30154/g.69132 Transcript_30154/m.69132 type:complete len:335 (+) Transcript_30154:39-1043(+)
MLLNSSIGALFWHHFLELQKFGHCPHNFLILISQPILLLQLPHVRCLALNPRRQVCRINRRHPRPVHVHVLVALRPPAPRVRDAETLHRQLPVDHRGTLQNPAAGVAEGNVPVRSVRPLGIRIAFPDLLRVSRLISLAIGRQVPRKLERPPPRQRLLRADQSFELLFGQCEALQRREVRVLDGGRRRVGRYHHRARLLRIPQHFGNVPGRIDGGVEPPTRPAFEGGAEGGGEGPPLRGFEGHQGEVLRPGEAALFLLPLPAAALLLLALLGVSAPRDVGGVAAADGREGRARVPDAVIHAEAERERGVNQKEKGQGASYCNRCSSAIAAVVGER